MLSKRLDRRREVEIVPKEDIGRNEIGYLYQLTSPTKLDFQRISDLFVQIAFGKESLAPYKVPKEVAFIDALPRNPAGKILKRTLREFD